jgi:hypothetical protein
MQPLVEQTEEDGPCSITLRFSKSVRVSGFRAAHACMPSDSVVFSLPDAERQAFVDHSQPVYVLGSSIPADDLGAVVRSAHSKLLTMEFGCV